MSEIPQSDECRDEYRLACRAFRSGNLYLVPKKWKNHLWEVREAVNMKKVPIEYQYWPYTSAMIDRRIESIAGWAAAQYEIFMGF